MTPRKRDVEVSARAIATPMAAPAKSVFPGAWPKIGRTAIGKFYGVECG